jgi:hypothetical protein
MRLFSLAWAALCVFPATIISASAADWSIAGTVLTPTGIIGDGTLSISSDGKILSVGPSASARVTTA